MEFIKLQKFDPSIYQPKMLQRKILVSIQFKIICIKFKKKKEKDISN